MNRRLLIAVPLVLTAACAQVKDLKPVAGQSLPSPAYGSDHRLSAEELLQRQSQAAPERSVELRTRSEERTDDPFDLPPAG